MIILDINQNSLFYYLMNAVDLQVKLDNLTDWFKDMLTF